MFCLLISETSVVKLKKIFFSNNEIALNHGYEDSFNQSLQNALFNLSKTGQRDQNSTTHLNSSRLEIPLDIKVCSVFYSLFLCLSLFVCVVHRTSSLPGDFMTTQHFKDINHQPMILTSSALALLRSAHLGARAVMVFTLYTTHLNFALLFLSYLWSDLSM